MRAAFSNAAPRRGKGCSSSPQPGPRLGWGAAPPARGTGPLRRAASAEAEPRGLACAAGVARLARLAEAPPTGPEARTAPQPPQSGGRAAPEHLRRNRRGAGGGQGPRSGPAGAWPCGPTGWPRATAGGQLDRAGLARPWPPHFPDRPEGAGRAGGGTAAAQGGQGERPAGRRGGWDAARPQAGHGREPLSPGRYTARENKRGSAHRALPLDFTDYRLTGLQAGTLATHPRPRLAKSILSDSSRAAGSQYRASPCTRSNIIFPCEKRSPAWPKRGFFCNICPRSCSGRGPDPDRGHPSGFLVLGQPEPLF